MGVSGVSKLLRGLLCVAPRLACLVHCSFVTLFAARAQFEYIVRLARAEGACLVTLAGNAG